MSFAEAQNVADFWAKPPKLLQIVANIQRSIPAYGPKKQESHERIIESIAQKGKM